MSETVPEALHWQIAVRAYTLWEQEGCPHGRDVEHWLQAEADVAAAGNDPIERAATPASRSEQPVKAAA
jgi:hypothetical protein